MLIVEHVLSVFEKARLAQSVERLALNQVVVGSSPTVGVFFALMTFLARNPLIKLIAPAIVPAVQTASRTLTNNLNSQSLLLNVG